MAVIRILGIVVLGGIILFLMVTCDLLCGAPPKQMRIVGFNGNALIYEDSSGQVYERGTDRHYVPIGLTKVR